MSFCNSIIWRVDATCQEGVKMRLGGLCVVLVMVLVACGDDKATLAIPADPASATTCDELADAVVAVN